MRFFCLTPFLASKQGLCVHIFLFLTPNYYQSHCVISHHLNQQMAIFHPITPHLFSPLYPSSLKHCYVHPRLTPLSRFSSSVYHLTPLFSPPPFSGPADCVGIDFTLLMFITSSPSVPSQCTWAAKPPNICGVFRWTSHLGYQGATVVTFAPLS